MLTNDNFTLEHVMELKKNRMVDIFILERSIYAFGLLEALCRGGMPFIFKGGTEDSDVLRVFEGREKRFLYSVVKPGVVNRILKRKRRKPGILMSGKEDVNRPLFLFFVLSDKK